MENINIFVLPFAETVAIETSSPIDDIVFTFNDPNSFPPLGATSGQQQEPDLSEWHLVRGLEEDQEEDLLITEIQELGMGGAWESIQSKPSFAKVAARAVGDPLVSYDKFFRSRPLLTSTNRKKPNTQEKEEDNAWTDEELRDSYKSRGLKVAESSFCHRRRLRKTAEIVLDQRIQELEKVPSLIKYTNTAKRIAEAQRSVIESHAEWIRLHNMVNELHQQRRFRERNDYRKLESEMALQRLRFKKELLTLADDVVTIRKNAIKDLFWHLPPRSMVHIVASNKKNNPGQSRKQFAMELVEHADEIITSSTPLRDLRKHMCFKVVTGGILGIPY